MSGQRKGQRTAAHNTLLERLYQWAKHDAGYRVPDWFSSWVLVGELWTRGTVAARGSLWRWRFRHARGPVFIGRDVCIRSAGSISLGQRATTHSENHNVAGPDTHISRQGVSRRGIVIEDDCWLGSGGIVLDGVTVG